MILAGKIKLKLYCIHVVHTVLEEKSSKYLRNGKHVLCFYRLTET